MNINIFEYAARKALRFPYKGIISTEDLFKLNEKALDSVYKELMKEKGDSVGDSLIASSNENLDLDVKIEIVKFVFNDLVARKQTVENDKVKKEQIQKLLRIKEAKENEALQACSIEEIDKMIQNMM